MVVQSEDMGHRRNILHLDLNQGIASSNNLKERLKTALILDSLCLISIKIFNSIT